MPRKTACWKCLRQQRLETANRCAVVLRVAPTASGGRQQTTNPNAAVSLRVANCQHLVFADSAGRLHLGHVAFGATVDLEDGDTGDCVTYQIVGDDEADIKHGKISVSSPIARALIGKHVGDTAEVQAPGGVREYEILAVQYV